MAIYYYCSRIVPDTKIWEDLKKILNIDLGENRKKITYISASMDKNLLPKEVKGETKSRRNGAGKNLKQLGIDIPNSNMLWKDGNPKEMQEQILESDIVYLLGGNPIAQTNYLKAHQLDQVLKQYEGIVIGVSGGSMTMSKNVIVPPCGEKYPKTNIQSGIGLTELNVFPHLEYKAGIEKIEIKDGDIYISDLKEISKKYPLLGLSNQSIIRCTKEGIYLIGDQPNLVVNQNISTVDSMSETIEGVKVKKLVL